MPTVRVYVGGKPRGTIRLDDGVLSCAPADDRVLLGILSLPVVVSVPGQGLRELEPTTEPAAYFAQLPRHYRSGQGIRVVAVGEE